MGLGCCEVADRDRILLTSLLDTRVPEPAWNLSRCPLHEEAASALPSPHQPAQPEAVLPHCQPARGSGAVPGCVWGGGLAQGSEILEQGKIGVFVQQTLTYCVPGLMGLGEGQDEAAEGAGRLEAGKPGRAQQCPPVLEQDLCSGPRMAEQVCVKGDAGVVGSQGQKAAQL